MAARPNTWQEQQPEATWQADRSDEPGAPTWTEKGISFGVGMVPVAGPLANCCWNYQKKRYLSAAIDGAFCAADLATWGSATNVKTAATATKEVTKSTGIGVLKRVLVEEVAEETARKSFRLSAGLMVGGAASGLFSAVGAKAAEGFAEATFNQVLQETLSSSASHILREEFTRQLAQRVAAGTAHEVAEGGSKVVLAKIVGAGAQLLFENTLIFDEVNLIKVMNDPVPGTQPTPALSGDEAHGAVPLPEHKIPLQCLATSNFLIIYNRCPQKPTTQQIMGPMTSEAKRIYRTCLRREGNHVSKAAARLWTDLLVHGAVNAAVVSDNPGLLNHWVPYIRALNNFLLTNKPREDLTTRRKSHMTREQAAQIQVGQWYRLPMYVATSKKGWEDFPDGVGGNQVRIEFAIPALCFQACDIEQVSEFQHEREVLLVPYSPIVVTRKVVEPNGVVTIGMEVARDGRSMNLAMPVKCA